MYIWSKIVFINFSRTCSAIYGQNFKLSKVKGCIVIWIEIKKKILLNYNILSSQIDSFTRSPSYRHKISTKSPKLKENIVKYIFFLLIAGEEVLEAVHVQDHVTAEMVFEAENLRLTKKNYWPLLRKMQLGCLVPTI